jgi:hypothetical protein
MVLSTLPATRIMALAAIAVAARHDAGVLGSKRMTAQALRLGCVRGSRTDTTKQINPARNGFQVIWSHAARVTTQMVELKPLGDRPSQPFVCPSMGIRLAELSVSRTPSTSPIPARLGDGNFRKEALKGGSGIPSRTPSYGTIVRHLGSRFRGVMRQGVLAPLPLISLAERAR